MGAVNALVQRPGIFCGHCGVPLAVWETRCFRCAQLTPLGERDRAWLFEYPEDHRWEDDEQEEPRDAY